MRDAVNSGDARRYASVYSPSGTISIFGNSELKGRVAIEQYEVELLAQFPNARFAIYDVWYSGRNVVAHYAVNAPTAAMQWMGHEGLLFFTFNDAGEIDLENRYQDSLTPMAQLGALGAAPRRAIPTLPAEWRSHETRINAGRNIAAVDRLVKAIDGRQRTEVQNVLSANPIIDELVLTDKFEGFRGIGRWLDAIGAFAESRFDIVTTVGVGRHVLIEGVLNARLTQAFGLVKPSSGRVSIHRAAIIEFDDSGRITAIKAFMNGKELAESAGQWPIRH
ncbi:MAG: nuclear transport factor 2 family protein [Vicinamibacterales bacterium]